MCSAVHAVECSVLSLFFVCWNVKVFNNMKDFLTHDHHRHLSVMREEEDSYSLIHTLDEAVRVVQLKCGYA